MSLAEIVGSAGADLVEVRVAVEYLAGPVWLVYRDGGMDSPDLEALGLPAPLEAGLISWRDAYFATYDDEYPPDSRVMEPAERRAFLEDGRQLAVTLAELLGPRVRLVYRGDYSVAEKVLTPGPRATGGV